MRATILRIGVGIALLLTGYIAGTHSSTTIQAQGMQATIPSSYGRLAAGDSGSLWFEDTHGTLRQVTIPAGNTVFTVNRQK
jgi:hypothetical protein